MTDARTTEELLRLLSLWREARDADEEDKKHSHSRRREAMYARMDAEKRLGSFIEWNPAALDTLTSRLEALEAEHEAVGVLLLGYAGTVWNPGSTIGRLVVAHARAEGVMKGD